MKKLLVFSSCFFLTSLLCAQSIQLQIPAFEASRILNREQTLEWFTFDDTLAMTYEVTETRWLNGPTNIRFTFPDGTIFTAEKREGKFIVRDHTSEALQAVIEWNTVVLANGKRHPINRMGWWASSRSFAIDDPVAEITIAAGSYKQKPFSAHQLRVDGESPLLQVIGTIVLLRDVREFVNGI